VGAPVDVSDGSEPTSPMVRAVNALEMNHESWMQAALQAAQEAAAAGEVPVGAVVIYDNRKVGTGWNTREREGNPLGHAELIAMRAAAEHLGTWRLDACVLYCTLEPCPMCAGAIRQARIRRVVYGAFDPVAGAAGSVLDLLRDPRLGAPPDVLTGVLAEESRQLLQRFFARLRGDA